MKYPILLFSLLVVAPVTATEIIIPDQLLGRWEQDARNCSAPFDGDMPHIYNDDKSLSNLAVTFSNQSGTPVMNEFSHESGEGLSCDILSVLHAGPFRLSAKCASHDMPSEPGIITADITDDTLSISFVGDPLDSHEAINYHRCIPSEGGSK